MAMLGPRGERSMEFEADDVVGFVVDGDGRQLLACWPKTTQPHAHTQSKNCWRG
eukprot:CAMPEP_0171412150 /NCGR_PEP_ID=MMETSP0880-20121228/31849_1 /TAXON_ID=67004 /ORGANISM="Thalassiosira weissflogii, Strain CCMP1336" /LENGTH=53 /DNA_ID=CAMNT_0011929423 /DNA_START=259 /DNA_END=420 /DNA_ORIENTATION=+